MLIAIVKDINPFKLNTNPILIEQIKSKAKQVGRQEMTDEELKQAYKESGRTLKAKEEAVRRYFAEQDARWATEQEES